MIGRTALHEAASHSSSDVIQALLNMGADLSAVDDRGNLSYSI
jgi:ankyrin repeat protein